jgi:hypothetical protein
VLASLFLAACGSSDDATKAPPASKCTGDEASGVCVTNVTGALTDETGSPVTNAPVSVCGDICYYGQSDDSGNYDVSIGVYINPADYHLLVHARPLKAGFYYALPADAQDGIVDAKTSLVLTLPTDGPEIMVSGAGAPAQTLTSGDVTLDVPDGADVKLDVEDATLGADGKKFRALTVSDTDRDKFIDPTLGALALYALAPFEATFVEKGSKTLTKVGVSFTNTTGLAADTPVELLTMGSYYVDQPIEPGAFGPVATGHVSADGSTITLDAGEGIQYVTWLALREKK